MRRHGFRYVMEALAALFMPDTCASCGRVLQEGDCRLLCVSCRMELSPTCWKGRADNPVELLFRGVYPIARAHAQFYYVHDTPNAQTVFSFKYYGRPEVARLMAKEAAEELLPVGFFDSIDCIIPVPLFWKRRWKRGYNQSEYIARGLSDVSGIPVRTNCMRRNVNNPSQTSLSIEERQQNVKHIFSLTHHAAELTGKHVLIVDDVITTGATLRAVADELLMTKPSHISVFALAVSPHVKDPHIADWNW